MRLSSPTVFLLLASLSTACAPAPRVPVGVSLDSPRVDPPPAQPTSAPPVPDDIVARSAQPFRGQRNADGHTLEQAQLFDELARYDVVCLGEAHDAPRDHYAELAITEGLERRARVSGRALGVGFEMFQAGYGAALHSYSIGSLDDAGLLKRTQYEQRWGYPYAYYRPVLALGRAYGLPLKALNASRELTHAVATQGLSDLPPRLRRQLPDDLNLSDPEHHGSRESLHRLQRAAPGGERLGSVGRGRRDRRGRAHARAALAARSRGAAGGRLKRVSSSRRRTAACSRSHRCPRRSRR